tara:strand:- start:2186 stop:3301 length:1116 start_codon:yes stop_codon:yes gene_type:complete
MNIKKTITYVLLFSFFIGISIVYFFYDWSFAPNTISFEKEGYLYIPTGSNFKDVVSILNDNEFIKNQKSFSWLAKQKQYIGKVKPGRYMIKSKMSNNELINLLRSGEQEPVSVTFNNIKSNEHLAELVSAQLELDKESLVKIMSDSIFLSKYELSCNDVMSVFIPNTYSFFWNTSAVQFFERMMLEYDKFWNKEREELLSKIKLTKKEVSILASIVQKETIMKKELPIVAGLYINRLKKGMKLQADPTLIFAAKKYAEKNCDCLSNVKLIKYRDVCYEFCEGDSVIRRVLKKHIKIESPYNTYKLHGLPPGPICFANTLAIDAVLNYQKHNYLYMCADYEMTGFHIFTKTLKEHSKNAKKYHKKQNQLGNK